MKVKDLKAELDNISESVEVAMILDNEDIKKIRKLGSGKFSPGTGVMITDTEGKDAGVMIVGSRDSRPLEPVFVISVKNAMKDI